MVIAYLSDVRIPDYGHTVIKVPGKETYNHLYHCGVVSNAERCGVAIALSETAKAALLVWVSISTRLANAHLRRVTVNFTVVAVCAPTLDKRRKRRNLFMATFNTRSAVLPQETC